MDNPIIGKLPEKGEMAELRARKKELSQAGYPMSATAQLAQELYEKSKTQLSKIPDGAAVIVMGSTTGKNTIPYLLAKQLQGDKPSVTLYNTMGKYVALPSHRGEGKHKTNYQDRLTDQRSYHIYQGPELEKLKKEPKVVILDDVISTGESSVVLKKQLEKQGVKVQSLVAPLVASRTMSTERDIERLTDRLLKDKPEKLNERDFRQDIKTYFEGFPRRKLTSFETDLSRKLKDNKALRYQLISQGADYYRSLLQDNKVAIDWKERYQEQRKVSGGIKEQGVVKEAKKTLKL